MNGLIDNNKLPNLHGAACESKELFKEREFSNVPTRSLIIMSDRENYDDYLFRAHSFGRLMSGVPKPLTDNQQATYEAYHDRFMGIGRPLTEKQEQTYFDLGLKKRATVKLSDGAKTFCEELVRENVFGRQKAIETKYLEKGIEQEVDSIALYSDFIGEQLVKNTERRENEYWTGEADNIKDGIVRDFKTSWDFNTFPVAATEIRNSLYEWQLQVYMSLWGVSQAELVYCLVDTSMKQIEDEIRRLDWKYDVLTVGGEVKENHINFLVERICNMVYTEAALIDFCEQSAIINIDWFDGIFKPLPIEQRIKVFKTQRDEKMLRWGREMVALAREYMNNSQSVIKSIAS